MCLDARITRADGGAVDSSVTDLSLDGCCITGRFSIGEALTIVMPRIGRLHGQVRWSLSNRTGIRFARQDREP